MTRIVANESLTNIFWYCTTFVGCWGVRSGCFAQKLHFWAPLMCANHTIVSVHINFYANTLKIHKHILYLYGLYLECLVFLNIYICARTPYLGPSLIGPNTIDPWVRVPGPRFRDPRTRYSDPRLNIIGSDKARTQVPGPSTNINIF